MLKIIPSHIKVNLGKAIEKEKNFKSKLDVFLSLGVAGLAVLVESIRALEMEMAWPFHRRIQSVFLPALLAFTERFLK